MEQNILNYLSGYVRIIISGKNVERFLSLCAFHDIRIWNLVSCGNCCYQGNISRKDFFQLRPVVRKSRTSVKILKKIGIPFILSRHKNRKMFLAGIVAAACLLYVMSLHIWKIEIEGNVSCTDEQVLDYLYTSDIRHGMKKSGLECKELAEQIRSRFDSFSWVSAELKGTVLLIHIKETSEMNDSTAESLGGSSLYACSDGVIRSIYIRNGISHVSAGDEVKKGTLLVSGVIPVYDDAGEIASVQYVDSDADIVIQKNMKYRDTMHMKNMGRWFSGKEHIRYILRIGNFVFGFPQGAFRLNGKFTILQDIRQLKIMEHYYFPVYLKKLTAKEYEEVEIIYTKEICEQLLRSDFDYFMKNLEEKGVQIFENDVKIEWNEESAFLSGNVTVGDTILERRPLADIEEEIQKNEYG